MAAPTPKPYDEREDWLVSVHEAGHTVIGAELGFEPVFVEIHLGKLGWFGPVLGCGATWFSGKNMSAAVKFEIAVMCYAGCAAEAMVDHKIKGRSYKSCHREAIEAGGGSDYAAAQSLYMKSNPLWAAMQLRAAERRAQEMAAENWPEIEFVGRAIRIVRHSPVDISQR
jgi:hypothetical protein